MLSLDDDELLDDIDNYEDSRMELRLKSHNLVLSFNFKESFHINLVIFLFTDFCPHEPKRN